jgi:RNA-directed DNA polymerase
VIRRLNPIIRGWSAYYRTQVSGRTFEKLDYYLWQLTYKWATISHANEPISWVIARYFGMFNRSRKDRWVFGDRSSGAYLHRFAWTGIVRHQIVRYRASPNDPALDECWAWRRRKAPLPVNMRVQSCSIEGFRLSSCAAFRTSPPLRSPQPSRRESTSH